jgi:DNA-binding MarR family transcriptional regulator
MAVTTDPAVELLKILPELTVAAYRAAPHGHAHAGPARRLSPGGQPSAAASLTHRQMDVVLHLATHGPQTMTELAAGLEVGKAAVTEMVERLVVKGLARRDVSATDRRVTIVELTDTARTQADATIAHWRDPLSAVFARFPDVEPATLVGFLSALTAALKGMTTDA